MTRQFYRAGHGVSSGVPSDIVALERQRLEKTVAGWREMGDHHRADLLQSQIEDRLKKYERKHKTQANDWKRFGGEAGKKKFEDSERGRIKEYPYGAVSSSPPVTVGVGNKSKAGSTLASKESTVRAKSSAGATLAGGSTKGRKRR